MRRYTTTQPTIHVSCGVLCGIGLQQWWSICATTTTAGIDHGEHAVGIRSTLKAIGDGVAVASMRCPESGNGKPLIILANGPSLNTTIKESIGFIRSIDALTVNFAPLSEEFRRMRVGISCACRPSFFSETDDLGLGEKLWASLRKVDWPMKLLVPGYALKSLPAVG